jgi:type VI secretion system secreted protein Hcp
MSNASNTAQRAGYLKINGIDGQADDGDHKNWMDVLSIQYSVSREGAGSDGLGPSAMSDIIVTRKSDKASPKLAMACAGGKRYDDAEFHLMSIINGKAKISDKIKLKNVAIKSYQFVAADAGQAATEVIGLGYRDIELERSVYNEKGDPQGTVTTSFNIAKNEAKGV